MKLVFYVLTLLLSLTFFSCSTIRPPGNFSFNYDIENGRALELTQVFSDSDRTYLKVIDDKNDKFQAFNQEGEEVNLFFDENLKLFFFEGTPLTFSLKKEGKSALIIKQREKKAYK